MWLFTFPVVNPGDDLTITYETGGQKGSSIPYEVVSEVLIGSMGGVVDEGNATPPVSRVCVPGERRCGDDVLEQCSDDGTSWEMEESCTYGCDPDSGRCGTPPPGGPSWMIDDMLLYYMLAGLLVIILMAVGGGCYLSHLHRKVMRHRRKRPRRRAAKRPGRVARARRRVRRLRWPAVRRARETIRLLVHMGGRAGGGAPPVPLPGKGAVHAPERRAAEAVKPPAPGVTPIGDLLVYPEGLVGKEVILEGEMRLYNRLDIAGRTVFWYVIGDGSGDVVVSSGRELNEGRTRIAGEVARAGTGNVYVKFRRQL